MAKKPIFNYRGYLKILGAVTIGLGILAIITAVLIVATKPDVNQLGLTEKTIEDFRKIEGTDDDIIRVIVAIMAGFGALWTIFEGWLMRRAAKTPEKSTFLLVILVLSVISGVTAILSSVTNSANSVNIASEVIQLVLNTLALMSVIQLRKEVSE